MSPILKDAKQYLWRLGCNPDTTLNPNELLRDLIKEYETLSDRHKKTVEKLVDRVVGIDEDDVQLPLAAQGA